MNSMELRNYPISYLEDKKAESLAPLMEAIENYVITAKQDLENMPAKMCRDSLLSEYNYRTRSKLKSCRSFGMTIAPGDICYVDFGRAYVTEIGYQHFALVINVYCGKALVVPMTSNPVNYKQAYDSESNPSGLKHLMRLGKLEGLYKYSVLFLNDAKFINTARVIDLKAYLDPKSEQFQLIKKRLWECMEVQL